MDKDKVSRLHKQKSTRHTRLSEEDGKLAGNQYQDLVAQVSQILGNRNIQRLITAGEQDNPTGPEHSEKAEQPAVVQRLQIGTGAAPDASWQAVPANHRARIRAAIRMINNMVNSNRRLSNYFRDNAPGGTNTTLSTVATRANVWELINEGSLGEAFVGGSDMAYDPLIYRIGRYQIVSTLLHEMGHLASFPTEQICEETLEAAYAYAPFIQSASPRRGRVGDTVTIRGMSFGPSQTSVDRIEFNGVDAGAAVSWSWSHAGGEIVVRVPAGATSGPLVIINNNIRSNQIPFTILP